MIVFDVKCRVLDPIQVADANGNDVTIEPGRYHLQGVEHLVHKVAGSTSVTGTDFTFVADGDGDGDGKAAYIVSAENLAHFIARDEVEVKI